MEADVHHRSPLVAKSDSRTDAMGCRPLTKRTTCTYILEYVVYQKPARVEGCLGAQ